MDYPVREGSANGIASALASLYPAMPGRMLHGLGDRGLLAFDAIVDAALRLPADQVELRRSDGGPDAGFASAAATLPPREDMVDAIASGRHWLMLRNPETLPDYAALMQALVEEIAPAVVAATGPVLQPQMFLFVSSPGSHTPLHLDPEYNILFQIAGTKAFWTLPTDAVDADAHIRLHRQGDNLLRWDDGLRDGATCHRLAPGDALFVPYKVPHWVDVTSDAPSVSLSLTWKSRWSRDQEAAWRLNAWLARMGVAAPPPPDWPNSARLRSIAGRLLDRVAAA